MTVEFFGVRHHSTAGARLVAERIADDPPAAVLIEGPADYNDHLDQLTLRHELPLMIYSWAPVHPDAEPGSTQWAARRSAYYPLTEYSPEWGAIRAAADHGIAFEFIDLPWRALTDVAQAENRFADPHDQTANLDRLLAEVGIDTIDVLFDELVEIDPDLTLADFRTRMHIVGEALRGAAHVRVHERPRFRMRCCRSCPTACSPSPNSTTTTAPSMRCVAST